MSGTALEGIVIGDIETLYLCEPHAFKKRLLARALTTCFKVGNVYITL
jgi:hypothetical protein